MSTEETIDKEEEITIDDIFLEELEKMSLEELEKMSPEELEKIFFGDIKKKSSKDIDIKEKNLEKTLAKTETDLLKENNVSQHADDTSTISSIQDNDRIIENAKNDQQNTFFSTKSADILLEKEKYLMYIIIKAGLEKYDRTTNNDTSIIQFLKNNSFETYFNNILKNEIN